MNSFMTLCPWLIGGSIPTGGKETGLTRETGKRLLRKAHLVAQGIGRRVQEALRPDCTAHSRLRVLCVDDNRDAADTLATVIELLGYEVQACYDGSSALAIISEFRPDACLLDLAMPGMDGLELATQLKARAGPHPLFLIATTGMDDWEVQAQTAVAGFHYHLIKPVDTTTLQAALDRFAKMVCEDIPSQTQ